VKKRDAREKKRRKRETQLTQLGEERQEKGEGGEEEEEEVERRRRKDLRLLPKHELIVEMLLLLLFAGRAIAIGQDIVRLIAALDGPSHQALLRLVMLNDREWVAWRENERERERLGRVGV
jgi:hypothetical protein